MQGKLHVQVTCYCKSAQRLVKTKTEMYNTKQQIAGLTVHVEQRGYGMTTDVLGKES